jgi:hypothetical protein
MTSSMRDIADDLRTILAVLGEKRRDEDARHSKAIQEIDHETATVQATLDLQTRLLADGRTKLFDAKPLRPGANNRLESETLEILGNAEIWDHSEIKRELLARGIGDASDPNFGRSLQGALLSMKARDLVALAGLRRWKITAKGLGRELPLRRVRLGTPSPAS